MADADVQLLLDLLDLGEPRLQVVDLALGDGELALERQDLRRVLQAALDLDEPESASRVSGVCSSTGKGARTWSGAR